MACDRKLVCAYLLLVHAAAASGASVKIAVYWGQEANEGSVGDACSSGNYAYVIISYLSNFGHGQTPVLDLGGHCDASSGDCTYLRPRIEFCQSHGIKALLSLGGSGDGGYYLSSSKDAHSVANYLWDNFLGGNSSSRPFGAAVLDGIDFDIENGMPAHYDDLANALRAKGKMLLTAAPRCPYPDASIGPALHAVWFDIVWVQFYNRPQAQCQYVDGNHTNLVKAWNKWTSSVNAGSFYLGLPALAAMDGYIPPGDLIRACSAVWD